MVTVPAQSRIYRQFFLRRRGFLIQLTHSVSSPDSDNIGNVLHTEVLSGKEPLLGISDAEARGRHFKLYQVWDARVGGTRLQNRQLLKRQGGRSKLIANTQFCDVTGPYRFSNFQSLQFESSNTVYILMSVHVIYEKLKRSCSHTDFGGS